MKLRRTLTRYHFKNQASDWWVIIICFALVFAVILGFNTCTAPTWNDGVCPDCDTHYELRAVHEYIKYYVCPDCGQEVERY